MGVSRSVAAKILTLCSPPPKQNLAADALAVLTMILEAADSACAIGADGTTWRANDKVRMLTRRVAQTAAPSRAVMLTNDDVAMLGLAGASSASIAGGAVSSPNCNLVVAVAGLVGYPQTESGRIGLQAVRLLTALARCMHARSALADLTATNPDASAPSSLMVSHRVPLLSWHPSNASLVALSGVPSCGRVETA